MSSQQLTGPRPAISEPWHPESERVRLARAARQAALGVRGAHAMDAGPARMFFTAAGGGERLEGVMCVAAPAGGYDLSLRLVVGLVALEPLDQAVRAAVLRVAQIQVASLSVYFADLVAELV